MAAADVAAIFGGTMNLEDAMALADHTSPMPHLAGEALRVLRAEIERSRNAGVPDGWRLVPVKPTPEMLRAGFLSEADGFDIETPADAPGLVFRAMVAAAPQPPTPEESSAVVQPVIRLTGYQLRQALDFIAPDGDPEQLSTEASIQWGPAREHDEGGDPAGYYCWYTEMPEEGSIRLDEQPVEGRMGLQHPPSQPVAGDAVRKHYAGSPVDDLRENLQFLSHLAAKTDPEAALHFVTRIKAALSAAPAASPIGEFLGWVTRSSIQRMRDDVDVTGVMVHNEERTDSVRVYVGSAPAAQPAVDVRDAELEQQAREFKLPINDAVPAPTQIQPGNLFLWNWTAMQEYARTAITAALKQTQPVSVADEFPRKRLDRQTIDSAARFAIESDVLPPDQWKDAGLYDFAHAISGGRFGSQTDDLASLVRRLARAIKNADENNVLANQAMDYLEHHGLAGNPMR